MVIEREERNLILATLNKVAEGLGIQASKLLDQAESRPLGLREGKI